MSFSPSSFLPGEVRKYAGTTAPNGWFLCDGSSKSVSQYPDLFAVISYTYGGGGASFLIPDLRGRVVAGKDNMGGTAANLITAAGSGITGTTLGATGGSETHTLTGAQSGEKGHTHTGTSVTGSIGPDSHGHTASQAAHRHEPDNFFGFATGGPGPVPSGGGGLSSTTYTDYQTPAVTVNDSSHSHTAALTAGGQTQAASNATNAHQNTPPTIILNMIIKY